jgi:hypothetical protein
MAILVRPINDRNAHLRDYSPKVVKGLPDEETECSRAERCGSINEVGRRFQLFRISDLEMVAQICPRWNRLQHWFELVGAFRSAA